MKIVHISDIHWRSLTRHDEYRTVFENLFQKLKNDIKPDLIVNTGDTWHTKVQHITPEGITQMIWMFENLSNIAPVFSVLGNHDGNLSNDNRDDIISFVHGILGKTKHPVVLSKKAEVVVWPHADYTIRFHNFSCFDKENWELVHKQFEKVLEDNNNPSTLDIALFHGAISYSYLDNDFILEHGELPQKNFLQRYPFALLGDIHRRQFLGFRDDQNGIKKPTMGYAGSFIQQDFGELPEGHGVLVWDIRSKFDWDVEGVDIPNPYSMHTIEWQNDINKVVNEVRRLPDVSKMVLRIAHSDKLMQNDMKSLNHALMQRFGLKNVVYAYTKPKETLLETTNEKIHKNKTPEELFQEFLHANSNDKTLMLTTEEISKAQGLIRRYFQSSDDSNQIRNYRTSSWKIRWLYFDNLYAYGENNFIDFTSMKGTTGILGPNRLGKSSILGAIAYVLYNATDRGPIKGAHIINNSKKFCRAKVCIEYDNELYYIERSTKRTSNSKTATKLYFYKEDENGKKVSLNSISRDDTDREVRKIFGTIDDFRYTSLATQGDLMAFINEGNTERKKILARYLDITPFLNIGDLAKAEMKTYEQEAKKYSPEELANELSNLQENYEFYTVRSSSYGSKEQELNSEINRLIEELSTSVDKRVYEYTSLQERLEQVSKQEGALDTTIEHLIKEIETKKETLETLKTELELMKAQLVEFKKNETAIQNTKKLIHDKQEEIKRQKKKLKLLDEIPCGDKYPNCSFIHDSFIAKESLPSNETDLKILLNALDVQEKNYQGNAAVLEQKINKLVTQIQNSHNSYALDQANHKTACNQKEELAKTKQNLELSLNNLGDMSNAVEVLMQAEAKKVQLTEYRKELSELKNQQADDKYQALNLQKEIEKHEQKTKTWQNALNEYRIRYVIATAFSKTGIPRILLNDKVRDINAFTEIVTNHLDFNISLTTSLENNEVGIDLIDENGDRPIETCSGAEKTFAALALRLAFIQCSMLPTANLIFLDESFGALDETAVVIAQNLLSVFEQHFDNVFVISHDPYLKSIVTHSLDIRKDGAFSTIGNDIDVEMEWSLED